MEIRRWLTRIGRRLGLTSNHGTINDRSGIRNPCLIASEFGTFGTIDSALIKNLNGSGAFIETKRRFRVGEVVQLKFPLHYLDPPIKVTGVIAWIGVDGVGVKFDSMDANVFPLQ